MMVVTAWLSLQMQRQVLSFRARQRTPLSLRLLRGRQKMQRLQRSRRPTGRRRATVRRLSQKLRMSQMRTQRLAMAMELGATPYVYQCSHCATSFYSLATYRRRQCIVMMLFCIVMMMLCSFASSSRTVQRTRLLWPHAADAACQLCSGYWLTREQIPLRAKAALFALLQQPDKPLCLRGCWPTRGLIHLPAKTQLSSLQQKAATWRCWLAYWLTQECRPQGGIGAQYGPQLRAAILLPCSCCWHSHKSIEHASVPTRTGHWFKQPQRTAFLSCSVYWLTHGLLVLPA